MEHHPRKPIAIEISCSNCTYFRAIPSDALAGDGRCIAGLPVMHDNTHKGIWPRVMADELCGNHPQFPK